MPVTVSTSLVRGPVRGRVRVSAAESLTGSQPAEDVESWYALPAHLVYVVLLGLLASEADLKEARPPLAADEEVLGLSVIGDAVEHVVVQTVMDLRFRIDQTADGTKAKKLAMAMRARAHLVGLMHTIQDIIKHNPSFDRPRCWVDACDALLLEHVGVDLSLNILELVHHLDCLLTIPHCDPPHLS